MILVAMSVRCLATGEESSYHFSYLLDNINHVSTTSSKMLPEIVWDTVPSKLSSDHNILSVLRPF